MKLDEAKAKKILADGQRGIAGRQYPEDDDEVTSLKPFDFIYGHYEWEMHDELFSKTLENEEKDEDGSKSDPFTPVIRIKLLYELLRAKKKVLV